MSQDQDTQGATPDQNVVDTPEPEQSPDTVDAGTTEAAEPSEPTPEERAAEEQRKAARRNNRLQRRFGELTGQLAQRDRQIDQLLSVVQRVMPQPGGGQQSAPQDAEPQRGADEAWEDYQRRVTRWEARQVAKQEMQAEREQMHRQQTHAQQERAAHEKVASFAHKQEAFAKTTPDYYEALENSTAELPDGIESVFVRVPDGHLAAYAIAKNPDLAQYLWNRDPFEQAAVIASIVAQVKMRPAPQVSNAPPPGKPVSARGGGSSTTPSDNDSVDDWMRKRNAEISKRGG